jgi:hypothetical protein
VPSPRLLSHIEAYLSQRCAAAVDLQIGGLAPSEWVSVGVKATVVTSAFDQTARIKEAIEAALQRFLNPLNGGFEQQGWSFGQRPRKSDVYRLLESIEGVDHVRSLNISPEDYPSFFLICSGVHTIDVIYTGEARYAATSAQA